MTRLFDSKTITDTSKAWLVNIKVDDVPIKFKKDTGAAVTALPAYLMYCCKRGSQLSTKILRGAGNNKLKVVGQATVSLCLGKKEIQELVYFVEGLLMPLLGKPAIGRLDLIRFVDKIDRCEGHD